MRVKLPSGTSAELVHPTTGPAGRGLVVVPDVMGMRPLFSDLVMDLAVANGWSVCAFELYPDREDLNLEERLHVASTLTDQRVLGDAVDAADLTGVDPVAIVGFCMGGMYTLKAVSTGRFDRYCSFYGMIRIPESWRSSGQAEPLDVLTNGGSSSVLAIVGGVDPWTPPGDVEALADTGVTVVSYADADHGFVHDSSRPTYRPDDAADAWEYVIKWMAV